MNDWKLHWEEFLKKKFGDSIPSSFTLDLGEIEFYIPPLLAKTSEGFKAIQKHNAKYRVF